MLECIQCAFIAVALSVSPLGGADGFTLPGGIYLARSGSGGGWAAVGPEGQTDLPYQEGFTLPGRVQNHAFS